MRRIVYVSGTRADFGLMERTLRLMRDHPHLDVSVCVTGMHLLPRYGSTVRDIEASGVRIHSRIPVHLDGSSGAVVARAIGKMVIGMTDALERERPDVVLVLGDRGEMLAGAVAAMHLDIPVVHIHGGERSGTLDEPVRHAISKLAHYHFVTTRGAKERLIRMGEQEERVYVVGAPGIDELRELASIPRVELCKQAGFDPERAVGLLVFHPVHQEAREAGRQMREVMEAVLDVGLQVMCLRPNADAGGANIDAALAFYSDRADVRIEIHLGRRVFASWMAAADVMIGNSSSGIIEAATFGLGVVNIGSRQQDRERGSNVVDVPCQRQHIADALRAMLKRGRWEVSNPYGDGRAGERIVSLLEQLPLDGGSLKKTNAY